MLDNKAKIIEQVYPPTLNSVVGYSQPHDSAEKHVSGEAAYIDDHAHFSGMLHLCPLLSEHAHARILQIDTLRCEQITGVVAVFNWQSVPGKLDIGSLGPGDLLMAKDTVEYAGQIILIVAAETMEAARLGVQAIKVSYQPLPALLNVKQALEQKSFVEEPHVHRRGDAVTELKKSLHQIHGEFYTGGQEHFYLETQIALAIPGEDNTILIWSSSQNPTEVQKTVAEVLNISMGEVTVKMRRMGGGFGGKESQAAGFACLCAVVAKLTGRPAKLRLTRRDDMQTTGKRHPFWIRYDAGFNEQGILQAVMIDLVANCGHSADLSSSIVDRAMYHADNAYYLENAIITGYRCRTNTASNTAFRGFGGPQGMLAIEQIMEHIARTLQLDPLIVRKRNYYGNQTRNITHYHQPIEDNLLDEMTTILENSANYQARREEIKLFNQQNPFLKRGIALTPLKFGISFTSSFLNQAGALILIYTDGTVQLNHGGTEMGQGLNTKVAQIVAEVLQIDISHITITATNTGKIPNTSPTAASSGCDLNGKAAQQAAEILKDRLINLLCRLYHCSAESILFYHGMVIVAGKQYTFAEIAKLAWLNQIPLSATGYYRVPDIYYDRKAARGIPFHYFTYGVACAEVILDTLTGEYKLLRTDILHDVGQSINPAIDTGQIIGGFIQGMGWVTFEELVWSDDGRLLTDSPASYKIPTICDIPTDLRISLYEHTNNLKDTVFRSKAVGEPPFMHGIAVWCALQDAIASTQDQQYPPLMDSPITPERALMKINQLQHMAKSVITV